MIGEPGIRNRRLVARDALGPLGDGPVDLPPLGERHQVVDGLAGDDGAEQVGEVGLGPLGEDQFETRERGEERGQPIALALDRVDVPELPDGEEAADDAGHLPGEMLGGARRLTRPASVANPRSAARATRTSTN